MKEISEIKDGEGIKGAQSFVKYVSSSARLCSVLQRDDKVAQMLFDLLVQGVVDNCDTSMPPNEGLIWTTKFSDSLNTIISESYMCHPDLLRALLHIVIHSDIMVNPEALTAGK